MHVSSNAAPRSSLGRNARGRGVAMAIWAALCVVVGSPWCSLSCTQPRAREPDCPSPVNSDGTPKRASTQYADVPGDVMFLPYHAFGPQASAWRVAGLQWWQWEAGGSFEPCDAFDIRIAVTTLGDRAAAEARWPRAHSRADLIERGLPDLRWVTLDDALRYLAQTQLEIADDPDLASIKQTLAATEASLRRFFPAQRMAPGAPAQPAGAGPATAPAP